MNACRGVVLAVMTAVAMTAADPLIPTAGISDPVRIGTAWDWLPVAGYEREALEFAVRPRSAATGWSADAEPEVTLVVTSSDGVLRVAIPATATPDRIQLSDHAEERIDIAFVRPGAGAGLTMDSGGHLHRGQDWAVLVLPRVEAIADRRWAMLLPSREAHPEPCAIELAAPPTLGDGQPPLAAVIAESQTREVQGQAVLIHLAVADRLSGWSQRTWR